MLSLSKHGVGFFNGLLRRSGDVPSQCDAALRGAAGTTIAGDG
jgi:hypothetical protein